MTDGIGTTNYTYVSAGQLGALQLATEAKPTAYGTVGYQYDQLSRVASESIDSADTRSFTSYAIGRVTNQTNGLGGFTYNFVGSSGRLQSLQAPSQTYSFSYYPAKGNFWLQEIKQAATSGTVTDIAYRALEPTIPGLMMAITPERQRLNRFCWYQRVMTGIVVFLFPAVCVLASRLGVFSSPQAATIQPDFAFTGLFYHQRSGLYFAQARAYDPGLKRRLKRDPIAEQGGINLYGYVGN
jgi:RHS repeat-associated protein